MVIIRIGVPANLIGMLSHWEVQSRLVGRWIHMDRLNRRLVHVRGSLVETCWLVGGVNGRWLGYGVGGLVIVRPALFEARLSYTQ